MTSIVLLMKKELGSETSNSNMNELALLDNYIKIWFFLAVHLIFILSFCIEI